MAICKTFNSIFDVSMKVKCILVVTSVTSVLQYSINSELLEEFSPVVERLGFDENFVDITEMVEKRLQQLQSDDLSALPVSGHVYNDQCKWILLTLSSHFKAHACLNAQCVQKLTLDISRLSVEVPQHFLHLSG